MPEEKRQGRKTIKEQPTASIKSKESQQLRLCTNIRLKKRMSFHHDMAAETSSSNKSIKKSPNIPPTIHPSTTYNHSFIPFFFFFKQPNTVKTKKKIEGTTRIRVGSYSNQEKVPNIKSSAQAGGGGAGQTNPSRGEGPTMGADRPADRQTSRQTGRQAGNR